MFFAYEKSTKKYLKILFGKTSTLRRAFALKKIAYWLAGADLKTKKRVCLVLTNMLETGGNFNADILFFLYLYNCQLVSRKNAKYQFSKQEKEMDLK